MVVLAVEKVFSMGFLFRVTRFTHSRDDLTASQNEGSDFGDGLYMATAKAYAEEGGCRVFYRWDGPESQWSSAMEIHQRRDLTEQMR